MKLDFFAVEKQVSIYFINDESSSIYVTQIDQSMACTITSWNNRDHSIGPVVPIASRTVKEKTPEKMNWLTSSFHEKNNISLEHSKQNILETSWFSQQFQR